MAAEQVDTIVGAHVQLKGSLRNSGAIHIHGTIDGDVISDAYVLVGESAIVTGPITAKHVEVAGQVHGSITADEQIELQAKSMVKGDLITNRLSIKPGAIFIGTSAMNSVESPISDKKKPRAEIE